MRLLGRRLVTPQLERRERTNRDVVSGRIPERELLCSSIRVRVRLLFEPGDESACPWQRPVEIIDTEEQEEPVARRRPLRAHQRRMLVRAPLVEAEQDSSIRIEDLTKVGMARLCLGLAEERLVPFEATRHIAYADDRPDAFHDISRVAPAQTFVRPSALLGLRLRRALCPLPEAVGDRRRESFAQCPGHEHNLAAVVGFVGHEIA